MARPFRFEPPSLPEAAVVRHRLRGVVAGRWGRRLTTVIAGPGFGKTVLLADALAEASGRDDRRDVWLSCEVADQDADRLGAGLAHALGLAGRASIGDLADAVWSLAPTQVCFVLDDVHEIPRGSSGAALLDALVTELPGNGHLVLASREAVPVATARLAASGQLVRLAERDLLFTSEEMALVAVARGVEPSLLESTGGWPALVELTVAAGADLVLDYLWEEVLARLGSDRALGLARFAVVGGGDDEVVAAVAAPAATVEGLLASVPLVHRSASGAAALHPLWEPALRPLLPRREACRALRQAAAVHRARGRLGTAIDLLAEAEAWDEVLAVVRQAAIEWRAPAAPDELARWCLLLPAHRRQAPAALLAAGLAHQGRAPLDAIPIFAAAARGFRELGDVDGELAAVFQEGVVAWWARDQAAVEALNKRARELAAAGSPLARTFVSLGVASAARIAGHDDEVLAALADLDDTLPGDWPALVRWLRAGAHFRAGHLPRAQLEIEATAGFPRGLFSTTIDATRLRLAWLAGRVDEVQREMVELTAEVERTSSTQNLVLALLHHALQAATLGDLEGARALLARAEPKLGEVLGVWAPRLRLATLAAIAIGEDDEPRARELVREDVIAALAGGQDGAVWREHAGYARVLVPDAPGAWIEGDAPPHPGLVLAEALDAARRGDLVPVRTLRWPPSGVVRAHLPVRWAVHLSVAGVAAGNPPPDDLVDAVGPFLRPALRSIVASRPPKAIERAAATWLAELPAVPPYRLRLELVGPLELHRDDVPVQSRDLRRQRVRELLTYLAIHRRARREAIADQLWPEVHDGGSNLRVTLSYLQRALQPDRVDRDPPYFLRVEGPWLELTSADRLEVDLWELQDRLDEADRAERAGATAAAVEAYRALLPLWRGEPFADTPYASWADPERTRLRSRYEAAAVRAGELLLATRAIAEAEDAARRALAAEPSSEAAFRLLIRCRLGLDDVAGARRALDECTIALAALDLEPELSTRRLVETLRPGAGPASGR